MQRPSLTEANIKHLRESIELAADCTVSMQEDDGWYFAWANRGVHRSHTVATADGTAPIETLDRLAAALGVDVSGDAPALMAEAA